MKHAVWKRISASLILLTGAVAVALVPIRAANAIPPQYTVILDAGHGGEDGGAVADDGTVEKDVNLALTLMLKRKLEQRGIKTLLTREGDEDTDGLIGFHKRLDLQARATLGNSGKADLYVSIHANASPSRADRGFQVWYGTKHAESEPLARRLTQTVEAAAICNRIRAVKAVPDTLYIFRTVEIPCVLVECGFLSNASDLRLLKDEAFQEALTDALCEGITAYLSNRTPIT